MSESGRCQSDTQQGCRRCGECCRKGGPALHTADLELVRSGLIPRSGLITLRRGELAHDPVAKALRPLTHELVKLKGTGREWNCCYYDAVLNSCTIYEQRPLACRILKCWEPEELLAIVNKDTLSRADILDRDDPLAFIISEHDRLFPCPDMVALLTGEEPATAEKRKIQKLVNGDLRFRDRVVKEYSLKLSDELFYFGRPLFQLLQPLGIRVSESPVGLELSWPRRN